MSEQQVLIPDIGGAVDVDVIDILVSPGDTVAVDDSLITLEGDKASMDVPAAIAGRIVSIAIKLGDKVSEGSLVCVIEVAASQDASAAQEVVKATTETPQELKSASHTVTIPDIGGAVDVDVIDVLVSPGDTVAVDDSLVTLEGDKASMDVPSPVAGVVESVAIALGDKVAEGSVVGVLTVTNGSATVTQAPAAVAAPQVTAAVVVPADNQGANVHAGPAVRRIAHELNINLAQVKATGAKGRITKDDLKRHLQGGAASGSGFDVLPWPKVDFSKFGAIDTQALSKIQKISGANLHRNWVKIPHVTQFEDVDITAMEAFRQEQKAKGTRLTPIAFIIQAVVASLKEFPIFNASLDASGVNVILKKYYNIGVAVDTPNGLVVPVIRDADQKNLKALANELVALSQKARGEGLSMKDMQGGCFSISSLGGIGGTAFTPIINAPEVAILGVSRSVKRPVYNDNNELEQRLILPISLSYDHRVIDGAAAARFAGYLADYLANIKTL